MTLGRRRALALVGSGALLARQARADAWPNGPVTFVVGFAPGGGTDISARTMAAIMSPGIGQQIVVDNKAGAAGSVGVRAVANARPDGGTLIYAAGSNIIINPHIQKGMIDTLTTLDPICQTTVNQHVVTVNPKIPANSLAELIALAKKEPDRLTYSSPGIGSMGHLSGALMAETAGIKMTHVPYKGTAPAMADVLSGQISVICSSLPPAVSQIKAGRLRALAVTGETRVTSLPDVPTLKEQGVDAVVIDWYGLFAPVRTPDDVLDKIYAATRAAMKDPQWTAALAKDGLEMPPARTRPEFVNFVAQQHAFWGEKLKAMGIEAE
jgi:tripartite-type tricarboxylate transporter receptor subunit TctC